MVSEPEEEDDFEKMFEASQQARRIEKGRTIEGTIVAIGQESAGHGKQNEGESEQGAHEFAVTVLFGERHAGAEQGQQHHQVL